MKAIKVIGIVVLSLIALFLIVALVLPSEYTVERSVVIERSPEFVFNQVANYNNFEKWNPWLEREPEAKSSISGKPMSAGHKWEWEGEKIGRGFLEIQQLEPGQRIESKLVFTEPNTMESKDIWLFETTGKGTEVTWRMTGELGYPGGRYLGLFIDGMLGPDFEEGLKNLKEFAESTPPEIEKRKAENDNEIKPKEKKMSD
jgi:uncharacterized protein YndB with AHSA1/START domain